MHPNSVAISLAAIAIAAASAFFVAAIFYSPVAAAADSAANPLSRTKKSSEPAATARPRPNVIIARPTLDRSDHIAALEALQLALTEVGDGSSYVWHRRNGRLSGIFKPTASFRDAGGNVCRHLELWLSSGTYAKRTEGIACRQKNGVWSLDG